jgi:hypothetical protein
MKRLFGPIAIAIAVVAASALPAAAESSGFSTAPVSVADTNVAPAGQPQLLDVTVGHHATFDRVVFRFSSRLPGYAVRYVDKVTADPSDAPVPLEGKAFIHVVFHSLASGQTDDPAAPQGLQTPHFPQLRQLAGAGDFEGYVSFGLGLASKSGFRVLRLTGPNRLVVDVAIQAASGRTAPGSLPLTGGVPVLPATLLGLGLIVAGGLAYRMGPR